MIRLLKIILFLFALNLAACSDDQDVYNITDKEPPSDLPANYGYLVGTFTSSDDSVERGLLYYSANDTGEITLHKTFHAGMNNNVFVQAVPAGDYYFYNYFFRTGHLSTVKSQYDFSLPFKVQPGKVNYVGNIHFTKLTDSGLLGSSTSNDSYFTFFDHAQSDLPLIKAAYPFIDLQKVIIVIPTTMSASTPANVQLDSLIRRAHGGRSI